MTIVDEVKNGGYVVVEFDDEYKYRKTVMYSNFAKGNVRNPYDKSAFGIGYLGVGEHLTIHEPYHNKHIDPLRKWYSSRAYRVWKDILLRCYEESMRHKALAYEDCITCDEWHNFQNFAGWFEDNFYDIEQTRMDVDKDILIKNNKIYAPDRCLIVPHRINLLFVNGKKSNGLPCGIHKRGNRYSAMYNTKLLGTFETVELAVSAYEKEKRVAISRVADEYRDLIPRKVYDALLAY